jgi:hypothetical protein
MTLEHKASPMKLLIALFLLASACIAEDPDVVPAYGPAIPGHEMQGEHLLGGLDDYPVDGESFVVSKHGNRGLANVSVAVVGAELQTSDGLTPIGIALPTPDGNTLHIVNVLAKSGDEPTRYLLGLTIGADTFDPCGGEAAIPIAGHFSATDEHLEPDDDLTFSCERGVAYKCRKWGYIAGSDPQSDEWDVNQACVYMAKASYCLDGISSTREGTQIGMFDRAGIRAGFPQLPMTWEPWTLDTWPPPHGEFYVEAAWRSDDLPLCLSKARWASLPESPCGPALPDPRNDPGAKYCEELIAEGLIVQSGIDIINVSLFNDLPLDQWRTPAGDRVSTTRGFYDPSGGTIRPAAGMTYVGPSGVLLRERTAELDVSTVEEVHLYCTNATWQSCVVTTVPTKPSTHKTDRGIEGFVFKTSGPGRIALKLYNKASTGDYVTATTSPGFGYGPGTTIGYVIDSGE